MEMKLAHKILKKTKMIKMKVMKKMIITRKFNELFKDKNLNYI